ncbi:FKBP-type peptidyl-prolyl cis-trans isomerase [Hymenobacter jejuensis]|uniref:Peptidyl-prolyl cis-trans isomerase n=1 Tax=Hymenobacter jejuensis TaxID=2502781 RepID=A0A5B7ZYM4_9BACT|nr:FKBP-type peptidyl-prolyl cis-trans isomerase [Hymenobacter jejuensis]QDA59596.1 hypothetical protein FHG12_05500 [Hymenobacter jejuensis]
MLFSRNFLSLALAAGVLGLASCNKGGGDFAKTKSGIEYKIFKKDGKSYSAAGAADTSGYKSRVGKIMEVHVEYRTGKDSVLQSSRKQLMGFPTFVPLQPLTQKGTEQEAFSLLQAGDSGVFRLNIDTMFARMKQPVPPQVTKYGKTLMLYITAVKIVDEATARTEAQQIQGQVQQKMAGYAKQQLKKDDVILQNYIKKNNLNAQKDTSGFYYIVTQPGTGPKPKAGQTVAVTYKGTLLDGKEFDSSDKSGGKPIEFPIGMGQVIPGWDKALPLLNKGSKATLLIPSSLAYGQRGSGPIPADAPLRFDVQLVDVK